MSGACIETRALDELFPDWKERGVSTSLEGTPELQIRGHIEDTVKPVLRGHPKEGQKLAA